MKIKKKAVTDLAKNMKVGTGSTVDGKMSWKEFMAQPDGTPAPAKEDCVSLLCYGNGTIRKQGSKITLLRTGKKTKKCATVAEAYSLINRVAVKSVKRVSS